MKRLTIVAIAGMVALLAACKKENDEDTNPTPSSPTENLLFLGEADIVGAQAKAMVYSDGPLETGYNAIYVALTDSIDGTPLTSGHFHLIPMMDMGSMQHSCPVEDSEQAHPVNGYYKTYVVFSMPGSAMEWSLNMSFHNHENDLEGSGSLGIAVAESDPARCRSTVMAGDNNAKVLISMIAPQTPAVGLNNFEIVLHKRVSMMEFPAIEDYTVEIEPEMPSMSHGSPNNVNPVHTGNGHYSGVVNFTMTGLWRVHLKLYKNGELVSSDQFFDITL